MGLTSALFDGELRITLVTLVLVAAVIGAAPAIRIIGAPSVDQVDNRFDSANETVMIIETDLYVLNPDPLLTSFSGLAVDYDVEISGTRVATNEKEGISVGQGATAIPLWTTLENECIPGWWVSHVQNGKYIDLAANATISPETFGRTFKAPEITRSIDIDSLSVFNPAGISEVNTESPVASSLMLYINEMRAKWGEFMDGRMALELTFVIHNPKSYLIAASELSYDTSINDMAMDEGTANSGYVTPPRSTEAIEATTHIQNDRLDEWWVTHPGRDQTIDLHIDFYASLDAGGTTLHVPLDPLTYEKTFETDIFGSKVASDGSEAADEPMATEMTEATETAESETTTLAATTTSTATTTTTTATTPSSDGGTTTIDDGLL